MRFFCGLSISFIPVCNRLKTDPARMHSVLAGGGDFCLTDALMGCWHALEISDAVVAALSHQRENGALRVGALGHPSAAPHFNRAVDDLATPSPHAPDRHVDVADVEVIKPERDRLRRRLCEHAADGLSSGGEQLIWAHRAGVGLRFLPAEELAVESKCLLPVGGDQLMP